MSAPTLNARPLLDLQPDWDSYGAVAISEEAVKTAGHIAAVPLADGGIQIEMHAGGVEFELEIGADGRVCGFSWEQLR